VLLGLLMYFVHGFVRLGQRRNHQNSALQLFSVVLLLAGGFSAFYWSFWCAESCFGGFWGSILLFVLMCVCGWSNTIQQAQQRL
jgi:hypothetical protein